MSLCVLYVDIIYSCVLEPCGLLTHCDSMLGTRVNPDMCIHAQMSGKSKWGNLAGSHNTWALRLNLLSKPKTAARAYRECLRPAPGVLQGLCKCAVYKWAPSFRRAL